MIEYYVTCTSKTGKVYQCKHYAKTKEELEQQRLKRRAEELARRAEAKRQKAIDEIYDGYIRLHHASVNDILDSIEEYLTNDKNFRY